MQRQKQANIFQSFENRKQTILLAHMLCKKSANIQAHLGENRHWVCKAVFVQPMKYNTATGLYISLLHLCILYNKHRHDTWRRRSGYLTDGEHRIVGFSHGVIDESGHQFSDLVQITGPGFLRDEGHRRRMNEWISERLLQMQTDKTQANWGKDVHQCDK